MNRKQHNPGHKAKWVETLGLLAIALAAALLFRSVLWQPYRIPSGSMLPNLEIGDFIFVSKFSYGYSRYSVPLGSALPSGRLFGREPVRGDVVVFVNPRQPSVTFVKRLIGLPGDQVQMIDGRLYLNGQRVPRRRDRQTERQDEYQSTARYQETLPSGRSYGIFESAGDQGFADNTRLFTVPAGHYFMLGDNRDRSQDSRFISDVGMVPYDNLVGPARFIWLSVDWKKRRLRFHRLFTAVR